MDYATSFYFTATEIGLSLAGLALLLVAGWQGNKSARTVTIISVAALFGAAIFSIGLFDRATGEVAGRAFGDLYRADAFGSFAKVLIYVAAAAVLIVTPRFFERIDAYRAEYPVLMLFNAVGMGMMVSATDLMTLYIGLEMSSLSSYVLASFLRNDERSSEAGLKYFVLGALASGIILYGISLVYGFTGSTNYAGIRAAFEASFSTGALFGVVFVLAGLAFKISAVPFHMWTPDVYEGAPTPVTAFFASAPKVAAMGMLLRMAMDPFGGEADAWRQIVIFAALASIVVGALGAIGQQNLKRLLAYSSIANIGYALLGIAAGTSEGLQAMLMFMTLYVIDQLGFFAILLSLSKSGRPIRRIADLAGLKKDRPVTAVALTVLSLSVLGMPPLSGFWAKYYVFGAAAPAGLWPVAAVGLVASVVAAFYYLRIIKLMWFDAPADEIAMDKASPETNVIGWACAAFAFPLVIVGLTWLEPLTKVASAGFGNG